MHAAKVFHSRGALLRHAALSAAPGVACEFGVYRGHSLRQIRHLRKPPVFGFDSWQGLPQAWNTGGPVEHPAGHFACDMPGDFGPGVYLLAGWFADTIPAWLDACSAPVQLLHIDSDLYESAREVLFGLNERLLPGAVILFDELVDFEAASYPNWRDGEWRALTEWLAECGREVVPFGRTPHQQAVFVVVK